jgi:hypothetical protein
VRVELVEKLILFLAGVAVLAVGALVAAFSILPPRSGIPDVCVTSALATQDWLQQQRRRSGRGGVGALELAPGQIAIQAQPQGSPVFQNQPQAPSDGSAPQTAVNYFEASGNVPQAEQVPGFPWLRRMPNVAYAAPQQVPEVLYRKYQSFEETWDLVQQGGGQFVQTNKGETAYQVTWMDENSYLATRIGLRPGDKVISVNGQPIGQSLTAGKSMYEQLKGERRFAVLIERGGQQVVLSFYVNQ